MKQHTIFNLSELGTMRLSEEALGILKKTSKGNRSTVTREAIKFLAVRTGWKENSFNEKPPYMNNKEWDKYHSICNMDRIDSSYYPAYCWLKNEIFSLATMGKIISHALIQYSGRL